MCIARGPCSSCSRMAPRYWGWCSRVCWMTKFPYWWRESASASSTIWSSSWLIWSALLCSSRRSSTRQPQRCLAILAAPLLAMSLRIGSCLSESSDSMNFVRTWLPWRDSYSVTRSSTVEGVMTLMRLMLAVVLRFALSRAFWRKREPSLVTAKRHTTGCTHMKICSRLRSSSSPSSNCSSLSFTASRKLASSLRDSSALSRSCAKSSA
mmetsp:Transcript_20865/g.62178  ORF Transcript_20865/g.62178 Transcript_20865/m.62178 type:complete len:209 (-) Transcript_20865:641-1267(-)